MRKPFRVLGATSLAAVACLSSITARADILAQETFEGYTLGPLSGQSGGIGWSGGWSAPGSVVRADVVSGASQMLEVQLTAAPSSQFAGVRALATPIVGQSIFVGYTLRYQAGAEWAGANNTFSLHLGTNATATAVLNFGIRGNTTPGSDEFMIRLATGAPVAGASTGGQVLNGNDFRLVAQLTWDGAAYNSARMWLDPTATDNLDTPSGDASLTGFSFSNPITHIFWREAVLDADDVLRADDLTLGTTWGDVVIPEPSVASLAAVGGLLLLGRARRRK
jgi:hypothetical protein